MARYFDADAFGLKKVTFCGADHTFRPATLKDLLDYFQLDIDVRWGAARDDGERLELMIEVIARYLHELTPEAIRENATIEQIAALYDFIRNGLTPEESQDARKNSPAPSLI
jgi:hypothetical protein